MYLSVKAWSIQDLVTAAVSLVALLVSICASIANYRLAKRVAQASGKLGGARIQPRSARDGWTIDLIVTNSAMEVTITDIWLEVGFMVAGSQNRAREVIEFNVRPDDFKFFGVSGPELPYRLPAYDQVVWRMRKRMNSLGKNSIRYKLTVRTAAGETLKSKVSGERLGSLREANFYTIRRKYIMRVEPLLLELDSSVPQLREWVMSHDTRGYLGIKL
jgi:hypothetical protein